MEINLPTLFTTVLAFVSTIVAILAVYKRPKSLDATLQEFATEQEVKSLRKEFKEDLAAKQASIDAKLKELYGLDRKQTAALTASITDLNTNLARWQLTMERQMGNHDARIKSLEPK